MVKPREEHTKLSQRIHVKDVDSTLYELSGNNEGIWSTYCHNDV